MTHRFPQKAIILAGICLSLGMSSLASTQTPPPAPGADRKEAKMATQARGTFDVKITPQTQDEKTTAAGIGRMALDKEFHGDLEGTSRGEMLAAGTADFQSGVYVAIEKVTGKLQGKSGTFALHHTGTITKGTPSLSVTVVPGSGTGELEGLSGKMNIIIEGAKHSYEFEYALGGGE